MIRNAFSNKYIKSGAYIVVILLMVLNALFWGNKKEGYHGDELLTYNYICMPESNHSIQNDRDGISYWGNWHNEEYLKQFFSISGKEYNLAGTYESVVADVHPPVYYILFELFCSIFEMSFFSKWYGISFNIIFFIITLGLLWKLCKKTINDELVTGFVLCIYGFSVGAVSTVMLTRMYMVLTCAIVFFSLAVTEVWNHYDGIRIRDYTMLALATIFGTLTQYYFLIYAVCVSVLVCIFYLLNNNRKQLIYYIVSMVIAALIALAIFPEMLNDLFFDYRGVEAFNNVAHISGWFGGILSFFKIINNEIFGGYLKIIVLLCVLLTCLYFAYYIFVEQIEFKGNHIEISFGTPKKLFLPKKVLLDSSTIIICSFLFAAIFAIVVIAKVAPVYNDRYIFFVYPILVLGLGFAGKIILKKHKVLLCVMVILLLACSVMGYKRAGVNYLYTGTQETIAKVQQYSGYPAVFMVDDISVGSSVKNALFLMNASKYYPIHRDGIKSLEKEFSNIDLSKGTLVYLTKKFENSEAVLDEVMLELSVTNSEYIASTDTADVYLIRK